MSARQLVPPAGGCCADATDDSSSDEWSDASSSVNGDSLGELIHSDTRQGRMGWSSLLQTHAVIDSEDATYVIVFTRAREPGSVDCDKPIEDPLEQARQIFMRPEDQEIEGLGNTQMKAAEYHGIVREKIQEILLRSGFICSSFPSVDGDETFLKICLDPEAETTWALAEDFEYGVPLARGCYPPARHKQITNKAGHTCFAYTAFTRKLREEGKLQPFGQADLIRIAHQHLSSFVNLEELLLQGFIATHFPAAGFDEQRALVEHWPLTLPLHCTLKIVPKQVRLFFGEKIGFYFHFFIFYIRALGALGLIALCVALADEVKDEGFLHVDAYTIALSRIGFGAAVVLWAVCFEIFLVRSMARTAQAWGASNGRLIGGEARVTRATFDPKLVGTPREHHLHTFASLCSVSYCVLFVVGVMLLNSRKVLWSAPQVKTWLIAALIVVAKQGWGRIAPWLTQLENHKTQKRYDDALILRLFSFKMFFLLWPPLNIFMFQSFTKAYCAGTAREAAELFYGRLPLNGSAPQWPREECAGELNLDTFDDLLGEYYLSAQSVAFNAIWQGGVNAGDVCLSYCLPEEHCVRVRDDQSRVDCRTNCHAELEYQVLTQFIVHVASSMLFAVVPLIMTGYAIRQEVSAVQQQNPPTSDDKAAAYSDLEVQAKCQRYAKYEYAEWGGSFVEDFLELILGYAYISIFAMVRPVMILIATFAQLVEYGLIVKRMSLVTGRPYPELAVDIGKWKLVIVMIGTIAVFINGYIAAFVIRPAHFRDLHERLILLLIFGSVSLFGRTVVRNLAPDQPNDVRMIDDYNGDVLRKLRPVDPRQFDEDRGKSDVDLGLRPVDMLGVGATSAG